MTNCNKIDIGHAEKIIGKFSDQKILIIGDLMLDRYVSGDVSRISPEAPVPVVQVTEEHCQPGGAANVALNIQSLGGMAIVAGVVGTDKPAEELETVLSKNGICTDGVFADSQVRTTVKARIVAERQQVVRIDYENSPDLPVDVTREFCKKIVDLADGVSGVIIEDYGKGVVSQAVIDTILSAKDITNIPIGFDPKENHDLNISNITLATPNYKEACSIAGIHESALCSGAEMERHLRETGSRLLKKWNCEQLIITLGPHGIYLLPKKGKPRIIPTKAREVFDVSGAGDTVIAVSLISLASGASCYEAAELANYAAGVVVGKLGTAVCTKDELLERVAKE